MTVHMHPARLGCASMAEWGFGGLWSSGVVQAGHVFHHPNKQPDEARQTVHLNQSINVHMRDPSYSPERGLLTICVALHLARPRTGRWGTLSTLDLRRSAFLAQKRRAARELKEDVGAAACILRVGLSVSRQCLGSAFAMRSRLVLSLETQCVGK